MVSLRREKGKKGVKSRVRIRAVPQTNIGGQMKSRNSKRKKQRCDIAKAIDTIEQAATAAKKVYRAVEPIARAVLRNRRKAK